MNGNDVFDQPVTTATPALARRMPEHGRIRIGVRTTTSGGKEVPTKIETFRFTSHDQAAIGEIAALWGGEPQRWADAPTHPQWEVMTTASEIPVHLPPDPLGDSPVLELWSAGGCIRRCRPVLDNGYGVLCDQVRATGDGEETYQVDCLCATEKRRRQCTLKTRLTVILAGIRFGGGWRIETGSEHAARELPGMVDMIQALQARGITSAVLVLEQRSKVVRRKDKKSGEIKPVTQKFGVPMLRIPHSIEAIQSGAAALGAGKTGAVTDAPALGRGSSSVDEQPTTVGAGSTPASPDSDEDVAEAEVVGPADSELIARIDELANDVAAAWTAEHPTQALTGIALGQILARQLTRRQDASLDELDAGHAEQIEQSLVNIMEGRMVILEVHPDRLRIKRVS